MRRRPERIASLAACLAASAVLVACGDHGGEAAEPLDGSADIPDTASPSVAIEVETTPLAPGQLRRATLTVANLDAPSIAWAVSGPAALEGRADAVTVEVRTASAIESSAAVVLVAEVRGHDRAGAAQTLRASATFIARGTRHLTDDVYTTPRDQPLEVGSASGVLANDLGAPSDFSETRLVSGPSHGRLVLGRAGDFGYQPDKDYVGPDSFTYALDELGETGIATATIEITPGTIGAVDDYVVLSTSAAQGWLSLDDFTRNDKTPEGGALTVTYTLPAGLTFATPEKANLPGLMFPPPYDETPAVAAFHPAGTVYRPIGERDHPYRVPYTVVDAKGHSSSATATIVLVDGQLPAPSDLAIAGDENTTISLNLDPEGAGTVHVLGVPVVANGYAGTLYQRYEAGPRGPAVVSSSIPYEITNTSGRIYFIPQPFKHSSQNPDGTLAPFATVPFLVFDAYAQSPVRTATIIVRPIDDPP